MGRTDAHDGLTPPEKPAPRRRKRSGKLVIVESPAKARTVSRFLGKGYTVKASVGHVRDLLRSQLSVDVENNFKPKYRIPNEKREVVKDLKKISKNAAEIYLATDPDREGEAIAWHLIEAVEIEPELVQRVIFHEITKPAVSDAFAHSRQINMDLVNSQQARRILDRLVGYNLSPLLWRKVRGRLSAGRVQSVALRLVVEREREIDAFVPVEYWSIKAEFQPDGLDETFITKLMRVDGDVLSLPKEDEVKPLFVDMDSASYAISKIKHGERKRRPAAPFITTTLQQEASRRLSFSARKTMRIAQQLYEGVDIGNGGAVGLITYMRTDSTNLSKLAQDEVRQFITNRYGRQFVPDQPPLYKTKVRSAQEAHEAVRPTSVMRQPDSMKAFLTKDQHRMYRLIWQRFVASQMTPAVYDTVAVDVLGETSKHNYLLRASGSLIRFQGFLIVYGGSLKEKKRNKEEEETRIPEGLEDGQSQNLIRIIPEQHFTQPPPRYTEASLVRTLEENGIGRPSTYAPILGTLQQRNYVERENRSLFPTETGILVSDLLIEYFPDVLDVGFTSKMEAELDRIAYGDLPWSEVIADFYMPFIKKVEQADKLIPKMDMEPEKIGRLCPETGHELVVRWGRYGKFISCSNFPECRYTEPWLEKIGVICPLDGGEIVERRTRKGRIFYGCENYPECAFTSWKRPLQTPCENCGGVLVIANKQHAHCLKCENQYRLDQIGDGKNR
ncbi:type I DNA topoisomerase [Chloroflexota bacterium]